VSLADDRHAEIEDQLDRARERCMLGRDYSPAHELAARIEAIPRIMELADGKSPDSPAYRLAHKYRADTALILLTAAITTSDKLREVADAMDAEKGVDPRQRNILAAYEDAITKISYPPTFPDFRRVFLDRFGEIAGLPITAPERR
jgi:hypothetical protein